MSQNRLLQVIAIAGKSIRGRLLGPAAPKAANRPQHTCRPALEALEDRSLPSALPFLPVPNFGNQQQGMFLRAHHHHHQSVAILTAPTSAVPGQTFTITGQVTGHGHGWPVVLVHSGSVWIVQPAVTSLAADGSFSGSVFIGNASTPPHAQFQIVVILAHSHHQAQTMFIAGSTLTSLPANLPASSAVTVTSAGGSSGGHGGVALS